MNIIKKVFGRFIVADPEENPVNSFGLAKGDTARIGAFSLMAGAMAFLGQFWLRWYEIDWGEWGPDDYDVFGEVSPQVQTALLWCGLAAIVLGIILILIGRKKDPAPPEKELDVGEVLHKYLMEEKTESWFD